MNTTLAAPARLPCSGWPSKLSETWAPSPNWAWIPISSPRPWARDEAFESSFSVSSADPVPPPLPSLASAFNEVPTDLDGTWRSATTLASVIELTIEGNRAQSVTLEECFGVVSQSFPYSPPRDAITAGAFSLSESPFILNGTFSSENQASGLVELVLVPPCGVVRSVPWAAVKLPAARPGLWFSAGEVAEARASQTATLLQDGTVLVAGVRS